MNLFNIILFILMPIIIQNKIIVKIEWRNNKSKIPEFLYNKLKSKENNRFKLQLSKQMMKTGLIENINLFTKEYDVCMFEDATLLTDYSLPIEQQINNKYYLTIKTYSGEQILTNYLITGFNKIVKINLSGITNIEVSDYTKENALEIIRPLRILKFIVNKFEKNLKLIITCKYEKIHLKFLLMEFNYYYESIHYERHVCPDNEYLIKIEQIEAHNQIKIPFNCDEAINEGRIENKYLINFDWNNYKNNGFKSPLISCTLFDQEPIIIENEQIKDDIKIINQLNKTLINEKSSDSKGKSSILNNYNNITEENNILNEYIKKRNKLKTYQEIYGGNDFEYKGTNSAKGIVEEAIKQIISSRNLREMKPLFKQSNISFNPPINFTDKSLLHFNSFPDKLFNNTSNKLIKSETSAFKTWKSKTDEKVNETINLNENSQQNENNQNNKGKSKLIEEDEGN